MLKHKVDAKKKVAAIGDAAKFLHSWSKKPLTVGSVTPSGKALSRMMARQVDLASAGPVIEIGPGTGPVTKALIERGIDESRLILVEYNPDFVRLLQRRHPRATVLRGDAYALKETVAGVVTEPVAAVVSSLPLITRPEPVRHDLLRQSFDMMLPGAPFVQFTYSLFSPIPLLHGEFTWTVSPRVWLNMPPARVWVYRRGQVS